MKNDKQDELLHFLKLYRHDLLNKLQLIQGYLQIGNVNKLNEKLQEITGNYKEEQKLFMLQAKQLILYLLFFNHQYEQMRLTYTLQVDNINLKKLDEKLYKQIKGIVEQIPELTEQMMYNWKLDVKHSVIEHHLDFTLQLITDHIDIEKIRQQINVEHFYFPVSIHSIQEGIEIVFIVPYTD